MYENGLVGYTCITVYYLVASFASIFFCIVVVTCLNIHAYIVRVSSTPIKM